MSKQLSIVLTVNETRLVDRIFPVGYDVFQLDSPMTGPQAKEYLSFEPSGLKLGPAIHLALSVSDRVMCDPNGWVRHINRTPANKPTYGKRKCIPLTDDEWDRIEHIRDKYLHGGTIVEAVSWAMCNLKEALSRDAKVLNRPYARRVPSDTSGDSCTVTIRIPKEVYDRAVAEGMAYGWRPGAVIREVVLDHYIGNETEDTTEIDPSFDLDIIEEEV